MLMRLVTLSNDGRFDVALFSNSRGVAKLCEMRSIRFRWRRSTTFRDDGRNFIELKNIWKIFRKTVEKPNVTTEKVPVQLYPRVSRVQTMINSFNELVENVGETFMSIRMNI